MSRHLRRCLPLLCRQVHKANESVTIRAFPASCNRQLSSTPSSSVSADVHEAAESMQSLLQSRRTGTSMVFTLEDHQKEEGLLKEAIHRAVQCAQMAPNHKRTEPFSFLQIMNSSSSADQVAEIAYQVAARTRSVPVARKKKEKWSQIPAFLVTLVHKNQKAVLSDSSSGGSSSSSSSSSSRSDTVDEISDGTCEPLPYAPPETERQLEDYASASAAIQNVLLSLHADGIATKWATGPVICTPAFRKLVHAKPTDRIAGLIMVGGMDSTQFDSDKMEQITAARRRRRRDVDGDVLQSLLP